MQKRVALNIIFLVAILLASCATSPKFDTSDVDLSVTPQRAATESQQLINTALLWGGVIVASQNLKDETQLEVLAYPLDSKQMPNIDDKPLGRFLAVQDGYIETQDYAQGRLVTIRGTLKETRLGKIGENEYVYPTVNIDRVFLWPKRGQRSDTQFHFGIGVIMHN